jgi:predicted histone-like DNA-binding protein
MAIKYKVTPVRSPLSDGGQTRYIARPCKREKVNINKLCEYISDRSTVSRIDVVAVVIAFAEIIPELLLENHNVHIPPLGIFSVSFKSGIHETPEEVNGKSIKKLKIQFRPGKELKGKLKVPDITKA